MKPTLPIFVVAALSVPVSAVTLMLTDPSTIAIPPNAHADSYPFPSELIESGNPITTLMIEYNPAISGQAGRHELISGHLLFEGAQVSSNSRSTTTRQSYQASLQFVDGITEISSATAPAFYAIHDNTGGLDLTELRWRASYIDGRQRISVNGIIPEPTMGMLVGCAMLSLGMIRRR